MNKIPNKQALALLWSAPDIVIQYLFSELNVFFVHILNALRIMLLLYELIPPIML